jgi:hypothetical protein
MSNEDGGIASHNHSHTHIYIDTDDTLLLYESEGKHP